MVSPIFGNEWSAPSAHPETSDVVTPEQRPAARRARVRRPARTARARRAGLMVRVAHLSGQWSLETLEAALLVLVLVLGLVYAGTAIGERVLRPRSAPVIAVTVQPGDTLWSLADRYGYPQDYILKRVDKLAEYNHLPSGARLQPGQVIQVPVENPTEQQRILVSNGSAE